MFTKKLIALSLAAALLTACQQQGYGGGNGTGMGDKQTAGTILGGIGGAFIGSTVGRGNGQLVGVAAGTLLGAALGNSIGASLDRADMQYYNQTSQYALEQGQPGQSLPWSNPQTGNYGTVTPSQYYQTPQGQYCREYTQTITVGGKTQKGYGKACRQPDGSWQVMN